MILAPVTVRCPSNGHSASSTSGLLGPAAQSSAGRAACSCLPWPAVLPRRPHRPLLLPPLARPSLHSPTPHVILRQRQPHTEAEPVNPRTPLRVGIHCLVFPGSVSSPAPCLPRLHVVPFLGLAVIHRLGALGAAWSMWSMTDSHRKSTVHGEAGSWVHGSRKEVPPYDAENNYSST